MIELVFLGTSSMVPTKERNVSSILLNYNEELLLFDCGEGTQRQMNIAKVNRNRIHKIFITHWHGDHISGLIGLIQTIGNQLGPKQKTKDKEYDEEVYFEKPYLEIYGPKGSKEYMGHLLKSCAFDNKVDITVKEFDCPKIKKICETENYYVEAVNLKHKTRCLGYSFYEKDKIKIDKQYMKKHKIKEGPHMKKLQAGKDIKYEDKLIKAKDATFTRPGKKITFVIDTELVTQAIELAKNSDLLVCESTYHSDLKDKAHDYKHMTSMDAARIAQNSNSKKLILTHISQRYKSCDELVDDAKVIFENTLCAFDFMKVKIK